jgi:hypothetical protein
MPDYLYGSTFPAIKNPWKEHLSLSDKEEKLGSKTRNLKTVVGQVGCMFRGSVLMDSKVMKLSFKSFLETLSYLWFS